MANNVVGTPQTLLERALAFVWPSNAPASWAERAAGLDRKHTEVEGELTAAKAELAQKTEASVFTHSPDGSRQRDLLRRRIEDLGETLKATGGALEQARARAAAESLAQRWAEAEKVAVEYRTHAARAGEILDDFAVALNELIAVSERFGRSIPGTGINSDFQPLLFTGELPTMLEAALRVKTGERLLLGSRLSHRAVSQIADAGNLALQADQQIAIAFKSRKTPPSTTPSPKEAA